MKPLDPRTRNTVLALLALGLLLYLPAIWWGLPHANAPGRLNPWGSDELAPLGPFAELYSVFVSSAEGFNPQYPLFHYFVMAAFAAPVLGAIWIAGGIQGFTTEYPFGMVDPVDSLAALTLAARVPSLLMAAGVGVAAFYTGRHLWDRRSGVFAGVTALLVQPMFYYSRTSNVDMGALFWSAAGLAVYAVCLRKGLSVRRGVWLGVLAALATATKDASYSLFVTAGVVLLILHIREGRREGASARQFLAAPGAILMSGAAVYIVASGLVFRPERWLLHVDFILHGSQVPGSPFYFSGGTSPSDYARLLLDVGELLVAALGVPVALASAGALLTGARGDRRALLFALPALGLIAGVVIPVRFVLLRFLLPVAYVAAVFGGRGLALLATRGSGAWRRAALASVALTWGWALSRGVDLTQQMLRDSRYETAAFLRRHTEPGDRVGYYGSWVKLPHLEATVTEIVAPGDLFAPPASDTARPEFILVIPQQDVEPIHEWTLPDSVFRMLLDGSMGYEQVRHIRTPGWTGTQPVTFVNPPVRIFERVDRPVGDDAELESGP